LNGASIILVCLGKASVDILRQKFTDILILRSQRLVVSCRVWMQCGLPWLALPKKLKRDSSLPIGAFGYEPGCLPVLAFIAYTFT
jgi:hypothetical protein